MPSISFDPDKADLIAANRLHFWSSLRWRRTILSYLAGGLVFSVIATLFVWDGSIVSVIAAAICGFGLWSLLLGSILLMNYLLIPTRSGRAFEQQKALHYGVEVDWSGEGVRLKSAHGNIEFEWRDFFRVEQGRDVILLFQSEYLFNFIPRRALSDDQAADFINTAKSRRS